MFNNQRYVTKGVRERIPVELQVLMWSAIDSMIVKKKDYLQVFTLNSRESNGRKMQHIKHSQEQPDYVNEFDVIVDNVVSEKVYIIDDVTHSTMLLAEEY